MNTCLTILCLLAPPDPRSATITIVPEPPPPILGYVCADPAKAIVHRQGLFEWVDCK